MAKTSRIHPLFLHRGGHRLAYSPVQVAIEWSTGYLDWHEIVSATSSIGIIYLFFTLAVWAGLDWTSADMTSHKPPCSYDVLCSAVVPVGRINFRACASSDGGSHCELSVSWFPTMSIRCRQLTIKKVTFPMSLWPKRSEKRTKRIYAQVTQSPWAFWGTYEPLSLHEVSVFPQSNESTFIWGRVLFVRHSMRMVRFVSCSNRGHQVGWEHAKWNTEGRKPFMRTKE